MRILIFHPTLLPPRDYGGVERVVLWLAKGLLELGHEVIVGASPGSRLPEGARLLEFEPGCASAHDLLRRMPPGVDIVHFMAPPEAGVEEKLPSAAVLTVHGNGKAGERFPRNTVFLSFDHATRHRAKAFVHNGIDPAEYRFEPDRKAEWFLFLSKTSWKVKNVAGAVSLCARARVPLRVAGGARPISTRLRVAFAPRMRWVGPVSGGTKAELLARARALVFPVKWPEPFGLVVAEALMSGTPVIANPIGSVPELLPPDVGALPESEEEWIRALSAGELPWDPSRCRAWALEKFHYAAMSKSYSKVYERVRGGEMLNPEQPVSPGWRMR